MDDQMSDILIFRNELPLKEVVGKVPDCHNKH